MKRTNQEEYTYHLPVLCKETVDFLITDPNGIYVDATMGGAGHTKEILKRLGPKGLLYSFDRDPDAENNIPEDSRCIFIPSDFRYIKNWMNFYGHKRIDGVLADLGVSSHHFDTAERGFSFRFEEALPDMRMNNRAGKTATDILNTYSEEELSDIFYYYGELRDARKLANCIIKGRIDNGNINSLEKLIKIIARTLPLQAPQRRRKLSQIFQALRIEVNDELGALKSLLEASEILLSPNGRLSILTYHSLEDRIVKEWSKKTAKSSEDLRQEAIYGTLLSSIESVTRKPIVPSVDEIERNSRARSAKLRVFKIN